MRREFAKRGLRFVRIVFLVAALLFAAYLVAGAGWVGYHFLRDYVGAVHSLLNPTILSNGTPSAKSYVGSLKTSVAIISSNPAAISCTIRNVGRRSIRQMMVQINLRDDNGNILTWRQGPVIRGYYQEEEGIMQGASHTSQQPNSFSKFWAPFGPGRRIEFHLDFPNFHIDKVSTTGDVEVLDIDFMDGGSGA